MDGSRIQSHILILDRKGRINIFDLDRIRVNGLDRHLAGEIFDWQLKFVRFHCDNFCFNLVFHSGLFSLGDLLTGFCRSQSLNPLHQRSQIDTFRNHIQIRRFRVGKIYLTIDGDGILGFLRGSKAHIDCVKVDY